MFATTPTQVSTTPQQQQQLLLQQNSVVPRKQDFPTTGLPLSNGPLVLGGSISPVPVTQQSQQQQQLTIPTTNTSATICQQGGPTPPVIPSPATAALPPPSLPPPYQTPMQVNVDFFLLFKFVRELKLDLKIEDWMLFKFIA